MAGDSIGTDTYGHDSLEVLGMVLLVWNLPAVSIQVALAGTPTG